MFVYASNVLEKLKELGISTYSLTKKYKVPAATVQKLRAGDTSITLVTLDRLCGLLGCQPGDLLQWVPDQLGPAAGGELGGPAGNLGPDVGPVADDGPGTDGPEGAKK